MPGFILHQHGNDRPDPVYWPLAANQLFRPGDPVAIGSGPTANQLIASASNGAFLPPAGCVGIAAQGALGTQSPSRGTLTYGGTSALAAGPTADTMRSFYPATDGLFIRTRNFWTTVAGTTQDVKTGALRGNFFQIAAENVADDIAQWGVVNAAGVLGTHLIAHIIDVLDGNRVPVISGATLTAGAGFLVFKIIGAAQWSADTATATVAS